MLKQEIQKLIQGDVYDDPESLRKFSRDASLFKVAPRLIVAPKSSEDLKNLVKFINNKNLIPEPVEGLPLSLTARSAGTDMTGGPLGESIIIDFTKYFNHIKEAGEGYVTAEPGVYYRDFEKETLKTGQILPSYPASKEICALGGMVANNSGGEKTLSYGKTERYVQKLKVVLHDGEVYEFKPLTKIEFDEKLKLQNVEGEIYRRTFKLIEDNYDAIQSAKPHVSKNSAGYALWNVWDKQTFDLTKLFVGSQGTLGLITEIEFKLVKPKKHSKLLAIFLKDLKKLPEIITRVLKNSPESFESFDDNTLKLALRYLPDLIKLIKPKNIFSLAWQFLPEFWMLVTGGIPKLILLAEFTGDEESEIDQRAGDTERSVRELGVKTRFAKTEEESKKYWTIRRESFNLLRYHIKDKRTAPFIDDMVVLAQKLPEFLPELQKIMNKYPDLIYTIAGHVGDGNFHIIPLMDLAKKSNRELIPKLSKEVYDLVFKYGGSTTGEHNDGIVRTPYLKDMFGEKIYSLFEEIKKIFDPQNIFNPGKKVGGSIKYAIAHLAEENK